MTACVSRLSKVFTLLPNALMKPLFPEKYKSAAAMSAYLLLLSGTTPPTRESLTIFEATPTISWVSGFLWCTMYPGLSRHSSHRPPSARILSFMYASLHLSHRLDL